MPPLSRRASAFAVLPAALLVFAAYGSLRAEQRPQESAAGAAEFTVSFDFQALSPTGQPITDLKPDEITIRIDGKPRALRSLQFVTYAGGGTASTDVPPAFGFNGSSERVRAMVLVIDDESIPIGQERKLREALNAFIDALPVRDQVAIVTVPHGGMKVDLTTDRDRLHRAVNEIAPIAATTEAPCQTRTILKTLSGLFDSVSRGDQPITVAYISSTLFGMSQLAYGAKPTPGGGGGLPTDAGVCQVQNQDFEAVGQAAAGARAQLYVVHPDYSLTAAQSGIENLRAVTGAPLFHLVAGTEPGLTRVAREASGYYMATFDASRADRNGMPHDISVKSSRRDVEVRSRPKIVMETGGAATSASGSLYTTREMVRTTRPFRDLPLRAAGYASRPTGGGDAINVLALFEPAAKDVTLTSASAGLFDNTGRLVAQWNAVAGDLATPGVVALAMAAPPGAYRLRVAAADANGRSGAVDTNVEAELTPAGPLKLSSLMLGLSRNGGFSPRLQFTTETTAIAYFEVYDATPNTRANAIFELAESVNGPAVATFSAGLDATSVPGRFRMTTTIPVGALPPGDYVIRAIVGLEGQAAGRVIRTLHKAGS